MKRPINPEKPEGMTDAEFNELLKKEEEAFNEYMKEMRESIDTVIIVRNSIKCLKCGDNVESRSRHDFRSCKCGAVSVDGGKEYLRRCGNPEDYEDTSICKEPSLSASGPVPKGGAKA